MSKHELRHAFYVIIAIDAEVKPIGVDDDRGHGEPAPTTWT